MCNGDVAPVGLLPLGLCMGELSELRVEQSKNAGGTPASLLRMAAQVQTRRDFQLEQHKGNLVAQVKTSLGFLLESHDRNLKGYRTYFFGD